jgi:hypothetical protein
VGQYAGLLQSRVLAPPGGAAGRAAGLVYHLADIFLPELRAAAAGGGGPADPAAPPPLAGARAAPKAGAKRPRGGSSGGEQVPAAAVEALLAPFVEALKTTPEKAAILRIRWAGCRFCCDSHCGAPLHALTCGRAPVPYICCPAPASAHRTHTPPPLPTPPPHAA